MEQSRAFGKLYLQSAQKAMRSASLQVSSNTECSTGIHAGLADSSDASADLYQLHVGTLLPIDSSASLPLFLTWLLCAAWLLLYWGSVAYEAFNWYEHIRTSHKYHVPYCISSVTQVPCALLYIICRSSCS